MEFRTLNGNSGRGDDVAPTIDLDLAHVPELPEQRSAAIGVIGAGFIVADIQLVAYRDAGFNVQAIASRSPARAEAAASAHGIPTTHQTWQDLIEDESIEVLDVAFPPALQPEIIEEAAKRPHIKGILAQKPLAGDYAGALGAVEACEGGPLLAVNQNMRFDQSMRAAKTLLDRGALGEPVLATIEMRAIPHWQTFLEGTDRLTLQNMSIHHIDVLRHLFGDPEGIYVSARKDPRTRFDHMDGICLYVMEWQDGMRASVCDDVWTGPVREGGDGDIYIRWRIEGTEGVAWGEIGWPWYPERRPSTLKFTSTTQPGYVFEPRWPEVWFPDAFQGTMGELLGALQGGELTINGRDNLVTMALVEAGYRSLAEKRFVRVDEITGGPLTAAAAAPAAS
jgi:predicted dehydrogenase